MKKLLKEIFIKKIGLWFIVLAPLQTSVILQLMMPAAMNGVLPTFVFSFFCCAAMGWIGASVKGGKAYFGQGAIYGGRVGGFLVTTLMSLGGSWFYMWGFLILYPPFYITVFLMGGGVGFLVGWKKINWPWKDWVDESSNFKGR